MASLQVGATPVEDVITETEATTNEPQVVAPTPPPPAEMVKTLDVEDEENLEDLTAPPYEEKVENSENEEEKGVEYWPFIEREDAPPLSYAAGEPATFGNFNEDDDAEDEDEDEDDDAIN